jgi:predicted 3-demethylubiquinone-9 3-methyltransferase (glyoxalase superfamily)
MKKPIYPCLWFDGKALEAAEFYCSVFPASEILSSTPLVVHFTINGTRFMGLNGGPIYRITEGVSFVIECESQEEIDYYWERLTEGGEESMCGWLRDRYGVSWQVIPAILEELMNDPERGPRVIEAFLKMRKFDIGTLLKA